MHGASAHLNLQINSSTSVRVYIMERVCVVSGEADALLRLIKPNAGRERPFSFKLEVNAT